MKNRNRIMTVIATALSCVTLLAACSSAKQQADYSHKTVRPQNAGFYEWTTASDNQFAEAPADAENEWFEYAEDENSKIVWTGMVSMESTSWDETKAALRDLFTRYGVQVMDSHESGGTSYYENGTDRKNARSAEYILRVPSEHFGAFMNGFSEVKGSVTSSSVSRADMTKQYNENEITLDLLNTEYSELKELMKEAKDLSEILMLRDRMTEVMKEIKVLSQSNNTIDYDVQFSKVSLNLREVMVYTDPSKGESWFTRFGKAFAQGASDFLDFLGDAVIWFGGHLFYLILALAIIGLPIFFIIRKIRKKKGLKKNPGKEAQTEEKRFKAPEDK
ncbi:MAG: DUF4349 domain-containing protein [Lachnospiraceae bacterium]|nr:DUF4349 domain-containing protein [Lachnospiraceae bacterium]